jgi:glycosyltransferase involved in cell wall biosynthesis
MAKKDNEVHVFTTSADRADETSIEDSIKIVRYGIVSRLKSSNFSPKLFFRPTDYELDIAHASFDIPPAPFSALGHVITKKTPLVVTYHGDWDESYGSPVRRIGVAFTNRFLVDQLLSRAKAIICPSGIYAKKSPFLHKYIEKVKVIPNGVRREDFQTSLSKEACRQKAGFPQESKIILFVGNLSFYKAPDVLIKALKNVLRTFPDALLVLAGAGAMHSQLINLAKELDLEKNIRFVGLINENERAIIYKSADLFCLPSRIECYPLTILEAMSAGVPVISTDVGGIPDMVKDGHNGLLVKPDDASMLADSILKVLGNEGLAMQFVQNGQYQAIDCSWGSIAERTEEVYQSIIR